jgi:uncharacterized delta-60 repeat protein
MASLTNLWGSLTRRCLKMKKYTSSGGLVSAVVAPARMPQSRHAISEPPRYSRKTPSDGRFRVSGQALSLRDCFHLLAFMIGSAEGFAQPLLIRLPDPITSLAVQADGQFLVVHGAALTRFENDGAIDTTFTQTGPATLGIENDTSVLLRTDSSIKRLNANGVQETVFRGFQNSFALQPDGKIVVFARQSLSRLNSDGTADSAFNSNSIGTVVFFSPPVIQLQEDNKIVLAASMDGLIRRFNPEGSSDPGFHAPVLEAPILYTMLVQPNGKILLGGLFEKVGNDPRNGLARLNSDGTLDLSFNPASEIGTTIFSMAMQANGKILLTGRFNSMDGQPSTNIARLNPEGTLDTGFSVISPANPGNSPIPLALEEDGTVLAGFSSNLVRIANSEQATQSFVHVGSTLTWLRGGSSPEVFHTSFQSSVDGVDWTELGTGKRITGGWSLNGVAVPLGSRLRVRGYVTGTSYYLDFVPGPPAILTQPLDQTNNVNTVAALRVIAKGLEPMNFQWFKDGQSLTGAQSASLVLSNVTGADSGGYSVTVSNAEGFSTSRVAQLSVIDPVIFKQPTSVWLNAGEPLSLSVDAAGTGLVYQWKKDAQIIPGATSSTFVVTNAGTAQTGNYQVILTGTYGTLESAIVSAHVNSALMTAWNPKFEATTEWGLFQAGVIHDNDLFVGGLFRTQVTPFRRDLVKFKIDDPAIDPSFAPEPKNDDDLGGVTTLTIAPNGQLMVGGNFSTISGQRQPYLARLQPDASLDPLFKPVLEGPFAGLFTEVYDIEYQPDGRILIVGDFSSVNGQSRPGVARLFPDGTLDESFNPDVSSVPRLTWASLLQPDGKIIIYGWDLMRLNADGTADTDFAGSINADSFGSVQLLPNNQLLVNSQAAVFEPIVTLLNPDGTVDFNFTGSRTHGSLVGLQADGKILIYKLAEKTPITIVVTNGSTVTPTTSFSSRSVLFRYDSDGSEDPSFSPVFNGSVMAMQADGSFIIDEGFKNEGGVVVPGLGHIMNTEPGTQYLTFDGTNATWFRGGTSPEVIRTVFEFSADGSAWTNLGEGVRIEGGWRVGGLQLNSRGTLRARGFLNGSIYESAIEIPMSVKFEAISYPQNGQTILRSTAPAGAAIVLQMSTDLKQWTSLQTNSAGGQPLLFSLTNTPLSHAFYRLYQKTN